MTTDHKELCERLYCEGAFALAYGSDEVSRLCTDAKAAIEAQATQIAELDAQLEQRVSLRDMCHALMCADISMPECRLALRVTGVPPSPAEFEDAVRAAISASKGERG